MPRQTETQVLEKLNKGQNLSDVDLKKLSTKIGKGQTQSRAREIAHGTEQAYSDRLSKLNPQQQQSVASAVKDYTGSSDTINTNCRQGNLDTTITRIDAALKTLKGNGPATHRVCYRLMSYKNGAHVPYGATKGNIIQVGDHVRDAAYVSASETRQFLVKGIKNATADTRYVKIVMVGRGGVNIAGGSTYNNENEQKLLKMLHPQTWRFRTAGAGQAEILYERNTVFHIDKITVSGNDVHVVMSIPTNMSNSAAIKDSYSGALVTPSMSTTSKEAAQVWREGAADVGLIVGAMAAETAPPIGSSVPPILRFQISNLRFPMRGLRFRELQFRNSTSG